MNYIIHFLGVHSGLLVSILDGSVQRARETAIAARCQNGISVSTELTGRTALVTGANQSHRQGDRLASRQARRSINRRAAVMRIVAPPSPTRSSKPLGKPTLSPPTSRTPRTRTASTPPTADDEVARSRCTRPGRPGPSRRPLTRSHGAGRLSSVPVSWRSLVSVSSGALALRLELTTQTKMVTFWNVHPNVCMIERSTPDGIGG